jgi:hypothetical protein
MAKKRIPIYIVVVAKESLQDDCDCISRREDGSWSSFIGIDKTETIERASKARDRYELKGYGPYVCYVGQLSERVKVPTNFKLVKI